jgi:hypothetical protein
MREAQVLLQAGVERHLSQALHLGSGFLFGLGGGSLCRSRKANDRFDELQIHVAELRREGGRESVRGGAGEGRDLVDEEGVQGVGESSERIILHEAIAIRCQGVELGEDVAVPSEL